MSGSRVKALRRLFIKRTGRPPQGAQFHALTGRYVGRMDEFRPIKAKWREYLRSGGAKNAR